MSTPIFISLLGINLFIPALLIGYKRLFNKLQLISLFFILIIFTISSLFSNLMTLAMLILFIVLEIIFAYYKLKNLLTPALFIIIQIGLTVLTWTITYDLPRFFLNRSFELDNLQNEIELWHLYIYQPLFLCFSLFILKILDNKHSIWLSVSEIKKKHIIGSIFIIAFDIFLFVSRQSAVFNNFKISYYYITILIILYSLFFVLFLFYANQLYKNELELQILSQEMENMDEQITLSNDFKHDFKAFIYSMRRYTETEDLQGAKDYLDKIESYSTDLVKGNNYSQILRIPVPAIQGLLFKLVSTCQEKNIDISLNIQKMPLRVDIGLIDFIRAASILFNNAVDGSTGKIYIGMIGINSGIRMTVRNTTDRSQGMQDFFKHGYSTKDGHRGIGLNNFIKIVNKYNNITYTADIDNGWITFTLIIN